MLQWVGKRPLRDVQSFPAQLVERFASTAPAGAVSSDVDWSDWPDRFDRGGLLFHGDNKEVLALAYIPERRQDLVDGSYIVERPANSVRQIAVRITDMLGEEVLAIEERAGQ